MEGGHADVTEIARGLESEVEPTDGTELPPSQDRTLIDEELLLMGEQRMWFLEMESPRGEDAVKTVGLATEDLLNW